MQLSSWAGRLRLPPIWSLLAGLAVDGAYAAWRAVGAHQPAAAVLLHALIWPGAAIVAAVYLFAWLGWALDID